jgi:predicted Zn-dependent protease
MGRQTLKRNYVVVLSLALAFVVAFLSSPVLGSSVPLRKRSNSDRDIAAIGHRRIACSGKCIGNWYSIEQEKQIGAQLSASLGQSAPLLRDPMVTTYLEGLAKTMAQNSDTQMFITVLVTDDESVYALTLPGGYQYISRGLLLRLHSEGELASVLARGIAHTALRSATREYTLANLTQA